MSYNAAEPAPPSHTHSSLPSGSAIRCQRVRLSSYGLDETRRASSLRGVQPRRRCRQRGCRGACGSSPTSAPERAAGAAAGDLVRMAGASRTRRRRPRSCSRAPAPRTSQARLDSSNRSTKPNFVMTPAHTVNQRVPSARRPPVRLSRAGGCGRGDHGRRRCVRRDRRGRGA